MLLENRNAKVSIFYFCFIKDLYFRLNFSYFYSLKNQSKEQDLSRQSGRAKSKEQRIINLEILNPDSYSGEILNPDSYREKLEILKQLSSQI
jgi:hypothetical protein